jgi:cobyrinic acid a,c-diamide synthase
MTEKQHQPAGFLIAAPKSNSGKTIVTLGILRALALRGLRVQPFKIGPDYIDPQHHAVVAGRPSYNLDRWMASDVHVGQLFARQAAGADVAVAEGVMGLFDGARKSDGSSADLARMLNLPVVLVVDAGSMAYSAAPLLYGFKNFDPQLKLAGVIFNKVGSANHYTYLKEAAGDVGVRALGYVPRDERLAMESRHLGLFLPGELDGEHPVNIAASLVEQHVDLEALLSGSPLQLSDSFDGDKPVARGALKIAFAHDRAFNFSYQANLDALSRLGKISFFSPLEDSELPEADLLWLPGGYPELFLEQLSANTAMHACIRRHIDAGKATIAECGGMMYLGESIIAKDGRSFPMAGVFKIQTSFTAMKLHLGYRRVVEGGHEWRGHEFHYSTLENEEQPLAPVEAYTARNNRVDMPVFRKKNAWGSYFHLYLGEPAQMEAFINRLISNRH